MSEEQGVEDDVENASGTSTIGAPYLFESLQKSTHSPFPISTFQITEQPLSNHRPPNRPEMIHNSPHLLM